MIEEGNIIKNLSTSEAVIIDKIKKLGSKFSLSFTGVNSRKQSSKILNLEQIEKLQVVASNGVFNFSGNPDKFILFAEAERINSAYQFDPLFAINCSVVDPLPHQVEAVYKFLLPQPRIRFLLADDTGAGKTIMTGLLLKELLMRRIVERILIVTPGGLTKQWQEDEMGVKFNIPFKLVNREVFSSEPTVSKHPITWLHLSISSVGKMYLMYFLKHLGTSLFLMRLINSQLMSTALKLIGVSDMRLLMCFLSNVSIYFC